MVWTYFLFYSDDEGFKPFILSVPSISHVSELIECVNVMSEKLKFKKLEDSIEKFKIFEKGVEIHEIQRKCFKIMDINLIDIDDMENTFSSAASPRTNIQKYFLNTQQRYESKLDSLTTNERENVGQFLLNNQNESLRIANYYRSNFSSNVYPKAMSQEKITNLNDVGMRFNNAADQQVVNGHHPRIGDDNQPVDNNDQMAARINIRVVIQREVVWRLFLMFMFNAFRILLVLMFFGGLESYERFKLVAYVLIIYFILKHIFPMIVGNRIRDLSNSVLNYLGVIGNLVINAPPDQLHPLNAVANGNNRFVAIFHDAYDRCVVAIKLMCRVILSFAATLIPNLIPLLQQEQLYNMNQQQGNEEINQDINVAPDIIEPLEQIQTNPPVEFDNSPSSPTIETNDTVTIVEDATTGFIKSEILNNKETSSSPPPAISPTPITQSHSSAEDSPKDTIVL